MNWILLSVTGALGQATGWAIKKKALQTSGMNNVIGFLSFTTAGLLFGMFMFVSGVPWPAPIPLAFWQAMFWYAGLNVVAAWYMYKALDIAEFNYLMPFMTFTSLSVVLPSIVFLGEIPTLGSLIGITLVVLGAVWMNYSPSKLKADTNRADETSMAEREEKRWRDNRRGLGYFLVTAVCYTIAPTAAKISIRETSVVFASFVVHILIGLGFLGIMFIVKESGKIGRVVAGGEYSLLRNAILLAGLVIFIENGSINAALGLAPVASVLAIKRLAPAVTFLIGYFYFRERADAKRKAYATALMVAGAVLITVL